MGRGGSNNPHNYPEVAGPASPTGYWDPAGGSRSGAKWIPMPAPVAPAPVVTPPVVTPTPTIPAGQTPIDNGGKNVLVTPTTNTDVYGNNNPPTNNPNTPGPTSPGGNTGGGGSQNRYSPPINYAALQQKAYEDAILYGTNKLTSGGYDSTLVDKYGVLDEYKRLIADERGKLNPRLSNPVFSTDAYFQQALDLGTGKYRTDLEGQLKNVAGDAIGHVFSDDKDDHLLQAFLDTQKADAMSVLERAQKRGTLNPVGYERALSDLDTQGKAGFGKLNQIGSGVLSGYRSALENTRNNALTRIGTADFKSPYDVTSDIDKINKQRQQFHGSLDNDIYAAVGTQSFYNPQTAMGLGAVRQGYINPSKTQDSTGANPLAAAFQSGAGSDTGALSRKQVF